VVAAAAVATASSAENGAEADAESAAKMRMRTQWMQAASDKARSRERSDTLYIFFLLSLMAVGGAAFVALSTTTDLLSNQSLQQTVRAGKLVPKGNTLGLEQLTGAGELYDLLRAEKVPFYRWQERLAEFVSTDRTG
jgi:hypothetical protein